MILAKSFHQGFLQIFHQNRCREKVWNHDDSWERKKGQRRLKFRLAEKAFWEAKCISEIPTEKLIKTRFPKRMILHMFFSMTLRQINLSHFQYSLKSLFCIHIYTCWYFLLNLPPNWESSSPPQIFGARNKKSTH